MYDLQEKIAFVTGAGQGIGRSVLEILASHGACVVGIDVNKEKLTDVIDGLKKEGYKAYGYQADVSNSDEIEQVVNEVEKNIGAIDALVNVAGVLSIGEICSFDESEWNRTFDVNTKGVFNVSRFVCGKMKQRKSGTVVTVSSNASAVPRQGMAAYAASKAAATIFTKCLALEMASYNIRCNIVSPGSTRTAMQEMMWKEGDEGASIIAGDLPSYRMGIPLQKMAMPVEIAETVLFLLSDRASHITMNNICVDGGATLGAQ
ncbi:MAG: 2,3-dihydro-2,3-dihydroxybenzoate dehydrogenase [Bacillus sp. (in: firmicutes)]